MTNYLLYYSFYYLQKIYNQSFMILLLFIFIVLYNFEIKSERQK